MKLLFDHCRLWDDCECQIGISWARLRPVMGARKDLRGSGGFSLSFNLVWWHLSFTLVTDYQAYKARRDYRVSDRFKKKDL